MKDFKFHVSNSWDKEVDTPEKKQLMLWMAMKNLVRTYVLQILEQQIETLHIIDVKEFSLLP